MNIIVVTCITSGLFFCSIGAIGALRLPDFYTRAHAIGVTDTLGALLILGGLCFAFGLSFTAAKLFLLLLFIYFANPTVTHVFLRAALRSGLKPWTKKGAS